MINGYNYIECECCGTRMVWHIPMTTNDVIIHAEMQGWLIQCTRNGHFCDTCKQVLIMTHPGVHPKDIGRDEYWSKSRIGQEKKVARQQAEERRRRNV